MKRTTLILTLALSVLNLFGQSVYRALPLIKASNTKADYKIDKDWVRGSWTISPQVEFDSTHFMPQRDRRLCFFHR